MKLGNYYQKSVPVKRKRDTSIIVTNDHIKKAFTKELQKKEEEVRVLQTELEDWKRKFKGETGLYTDLHEEYTALLEEKREFDIQNAKIFDLKYRLEYAENIADKVPELESEIKKISEQNNDYRNQRTVFEQQNTDFKKQVIELSNSYTESQKKVADLQLQLSDLEGKYPIILEENQTLKSKEENLENRVKRQSDDITLLRDNFFYWKDTAISLEDQLSQEAILRDELQRGLEILTRGNQLSSKKITKSGKAYKEAQDEILTLNNRNLELTKFTDQMSKIIVEQKRKLASAGQLSQGQIGVKEGFHIPFARENLRTKQLGNAKPTLLKFKETKNDNN